MAATYFLIRGIEPVDLRDWPENTRLLYWQWVCELGLKAKDQELARGLDKDGKALRPISAETRKHRRSAMTPTGRGDPSAPPLMPGRSLSRTRSLLAARPRANAAEFYWRFDPWTGDQWGKILSYQAKRGRNVVGLSREATARVQAQSQARWNDWKRKHLQPQRVAVAMPQGVVPFVPRKPPVALTGRTDTHGATFGIGTGRRQFHESVRQGRNSGWMTVDQLKKKYRQSIERPQFLPQASPAARKGAERLSSITGSARGSTNRVIASTWGERESQRTTIERKPRVTKAPTGGSWLSSILGWLSR